MHGPIASVAALTAQPLAALPPYGCGVPLAGSERLWQLQVSRHFRRAYRLSSLSLRGGRRPTWRPEREARGSALGVQSRSTWPDNRKVSGEYGTVTRRGVEDAATYKVCAVGDGLHEPQVPSRDCHVALLLAMTHQAGAAAHQCPSAVELPCTRRSLSAAAFFSRTADLYGSPQPTEKYPKFGNKGQNCPFL